MESLYRTRVCPSTGSRRTQKIPSILIWRWELFNDASVPMLDDDIAANLGDCRAQRRCGKCVHWARTSAARKTRIRIMCGVFTVRSPSLQELFQRRRCETLCTW